MARVVEQDGLRQCHPERFVDLAGKQIPHDVLVDADEEVGQVALEVVRWSAPVLSNAAYLGLEALGGVQRAASGNASTAVGDEAGMEALGNPVVQDVVYDAIAEGGGPDFARLRAGDGKADAAAGRVGAVLQLVE